MKPRFEEHEGQLFRMLEEPVPLTTDSKLPCLVRLIQDDSPMGRYNRDAAYSDVIGKLFVAQKIKENSLYSNTLHAYEKNSLNQDYCIASIHMLEIIGIFVVEGSKEWALYQMMQGEKVRHNYYVLPNTHWAMNEKHQIAIFTRPSSMIDRGDVICHANDWFTYSPIDATIDDKNGWQIYKEPKIEPPKEPDYVICKRCGGTGYEIKEQKPDNLYLNIKPSNPVDWCFDKKNLLVLADNNFKGILGENVTREQIVEIAKLLTEPAPKFKVIPITISGTVRQAYNEDGTIDDEQFQLLPNGSWDGTEMFISFGALDTHTRELVESILKAQEEKK